MSRAQTIYNLLVVTISAIIVAVTTIVSAIPIVIAIAIIAATTTTAVSVVFIITVSDVSLIPISMVIDVKSFVRWIPTLHKSGDPNLIICKDFYCRHIKGGIGLPEYVQRNFLTG
jgi:hypothetical protein